MNNRICVLLISILSLFFIITDSQAQSKGILPLTGIRYFNEGIWTNQIEIRIDGQILLNNRIPLNKEFEIKLLVPTGFLKDKSNMIFAAAELNVISLNGAILSKTPNAFFENESKGLPAATFRDVVIKMIFKPEIIKSESGCIIHIRYYDLKSKNQLKLEFPVSIAKPGETLLVSKQVTEIKNNSNALAKTSGLKIKHIDITTDTTIRVAPKMAYASLDIRNIEGTDITEVLSGKESFWIYDEDLNEIKISEKQLKQVNGAMENNMVNYLSKIPFKLKSNTDKTYTVRFRWESNDKRKVIEVVVPK